MKKTTTLICFIALVVSSAHALNFCPTVNGYFRTNAVVVQRQNSSVLSDISKLHLDIRSKPTENIYIDIEPEYQNLYINNQTLFSGTTNLNQINFHRAYMKIYSSLADISYGIQRVAWGAGHVWNPADNFTPFKLTFMDEELQGIDMTRVQHFINQTSFVEGVVSNGQMPEQTQWGTKAKTNYNGFDYAAFYIDLGKGQGNVVAANSVGELFGLGVRTELAIYYLTNNTSYKKLMLGTDYTLENGLTIDMEYFYNGIGKRNSSQYDWAGRLAGTVEFLGKDYMAVLLSKTLNEISSWRITTISNLGDGSYIFYPSYTASLSNDLDLYFEVITLGGNQGTEFNPGPALDPMNIFGSSIYSIKAIYNF